jgi:hypothetical protein
MKNNQFPAEATIKEFWQLNCIDCQNDNQDNEPTCEILKNIIAGAEIKSLQCNFYKRRWKK